MRETGADKSEDETAGEILSGYSNQSHLYPNPHVKVMCKFLSVVEEAEQTSLLVLLLRVSFLAFVIFIFIDVCVYLSFYKQ